MELPRNITQVGSPDKKCKIYVEDYVVSYMKQINKIAEDKMISVALFGRKTEEEQITYCFVYGACHVQSITKEVRHLSQAQNQEVERMRKKYFPEQDFLGFQILNGEMIEGFHICEQGSCRFIKGYACFFEKNDTMLAYMLEARVEETQPENVEQDKYEMVKRRQEERRARFEERQFGRKSVEKQKEVKKTVETENKKSENENGKFRVVPFIVNAAVCFAVLTVLGNDNLQEKMNSRIITWWADVKQARQEQINIEEPEPVVLAGQVQETQMQPVMSTLVTEDKLADAILEENENATESSEEVDNASSEKGVVSEEFLNEGGMVVGLEQAKDAVTEEIAKEEVQEDEKEIEATQQRMESYVIQKGDTLIAISTSIYGSDAAVGQICALNNISNPDNIQIGQKILLP